MTPSLTRLSEEKDMGQLAVLLSPLILFGSKQLLPKRHMNMDASLLDLCIGAGASSKSGRSSEVEALHART